MKIPGIARPLGIIGPMVSFIIPAAILYSIHFIKELFYE